MKKIDTIFTGIGLFAALIATGTAVWQIGNGYNVPQNHVYPANKYGAFLASQHAIYINDFENAAMFTRELQDRDVTVVQNTILLSDFLNGTLPATAASLKDEKGSVAQLIYDAHLVKTDNWEALYSRHKKDETALAAPLRIWSSIATGKTKETFKFIETLKTNNSWKSFVRGMIYAETGDIKRAGEQFDKVSIDFMNINDYMYVMAFYNENNMVDAAKKLRDEFTERPGGMYMLDIDVQPKWSDFAGYHNALAFSLIQNVSHTQIMMYSDLSLLMLRFAQVVQDDKTSEINAVNYYLGQFFFNNGGDFQGYFKAIDPASPFHPFAMMKIAEKSGKITELERTVHKNPLFVPASNKLIAKYIQNGDKRKALRVVNHGLKNKNLTEAGRAYFLKTRGQIYYMFDDMDAAQTDIRSAADILPVDAGILGIQARIWAAEKRELETAYEYAIALVKRSPTDIEAWDLLGSVVWAREGVDAALEVVERVGQISETCSSLFEHLGDMYIELGDTKRARDSYARAIELSDDGLTVLPKLQKKLRNLK